MTAEARITVTLTCDRCGARTQRTADLPILTNHVEQGRAVNLVTTDAIDTAGWSWSVGQDGQPRDYCDTCGGF